MRPAVAIVIAASVIGLCGCSNAATPGGSASSAAASGVIRLSGASTFTDTSDATSPLAGDVCVGSGADAAVHKGATLSVSAGGKRLATTTLQPGDVGTGATSCELPYTFAHVTKGLSSYTLGVGDRTATVTGAQLFGTPSVALG